MYIYVCVCIAVLRRRADQQKYETGDDACFTHASSFVSYFRESAQQKYETNDDARFVQWRADQQKCEKMISHASAPKHTSSFFSYLCWSAHCWVRHASSFVSYFCWADLQTWDKRWRMHEACAIICLILLLNMQPNKYVHTRGEQCSWWVSGISG